MILETELCPTCTGGNLCDACKIQTHREWMARHRIYAEAAARARAHRILEICAAYEIESDERGTAPEKAARLDWVPA